MSPCNLSSLCLKSPPSSPPYPRSLPPFSPSRPSPPPSLQSTAGPPSLRPVSVLFHLACCYRGLGAGRLQLGSQSFSIYQRPPSPPLLRFLPSLSLPSSAPPSQHQSRHIAVPQTPLFLLHSHPQTPLCLSPSHTAPRSLSSSFHQRGHLARKPRDQKKRNIVSVDAFKSEEAAWGCIIT